MSSTKFPHVAEANRKRKTGRHHYRKNPKLLAAWLKGSRAYFEGWDKEDCPYTHRKAQPFRDAWLAGYRSAISSKRERPERPKNATEAVQNQRTVRGS